MQSSLPPLLTDCRLEVAVDGEVLGPYFDMVSNRSLVLYRQCD